MDNGAESPAGVAEIAASTALAGVTAVLEPRLRRDMRNADTSSGRATEELRAFSVDGASGRASAGAPAPSGSPGPPMQAALT